jgi:hypothetical protein
MTFLYWLSLVIGGGLFLLSLAGDVFGADHDTGALHADADVDAHGDAEWGHVFSLRYLTYFLFGFGAVGVLVGFLWRGNQALLTLLLASLTGLAAWGLSYSVFSYLRRTESGVMQGDRLLIGSVGEVSLPISSGGTGKVVVTRAGHTQELLARPLRHDESDAESWHTVIVVDVEDGVALVEPFADETDRPSTIPARGRQKVLDRQK